MNDLKLTPVTDEYGLFLQAIFDLRVEIDLKATPEELIQAHRNAVRAFNTWTEVEVMPKASGGDQGVEAGKPIVIDFGGKEILGVWP